jgi:hypothetical protein
MPGLDTVFFVSGSIGGKAAGEVGSVAVFGGDAVISGSLTVGTGSIKITSNDIQFGGVGNRIELNGTDLKFFDASNPSGFTLTSLGSGGGGGGGAGVFTEASGIAAYTTSSIAIGYAGAATSLASDLFFYVSGSTDGTKNALFGGDVVTSGSVTVRDNDSAISIGYGPSSGVGQITSLNGNLVLDAAVSSRVIIDTDLEIAGANIYAGGGGGARNIFTDNTTPANLITIGGAGGKTTIAGGLEVTGNYISGSTGVNIVLGAAGSVAVAGELTAGGGFGSTGVTLTATGDVQANGGLTVDGSATIKTNLTVNGDFTVNGSVVAIDTVNTRVKDAVLLLGSGSEAGGPAPFKSIIAFASGSKNVNESVTFGVAGDRVLAVGVQDVQNGALAQTGISFSALGSLLALEYQVSTSTAALKGTGGSLILSGADLTVNTSAVGTGVAFQGNGAQYLTISSVGGEPTIKGTGTTWFSGSSVNIQANSGEVRIAKDTNSALALSTNGTTQGTVSAKSGAGAAQLLVLSGSDVTVGANNNANGITFAGAGTGFAKVYAPTSTQPILEAALTNATFKIGTFGTTDAVVVSGSAVQFNAGTAGQSFRMHNAEFLLVSSGAAGPNQRALITAATGKTLVVGGTSETVISGSSVSLVASRTGSPSGVDFSTDVGGIIQSYLNVVSGTYATPVGSVSINAAKIVPGDLPLPHDVLLGASAAKSLYLSGTSVYVNGGASSLVIQRHGASLASLSGPDANTISLAAEGSVTTANLFNNSVTSFNVGSNVTSNATYNLATGGTTAGNTKTINLGTGAAAGSTTTVSVGSIIGGTTTVNGNMIIGGDGSRTLEVKSKITGSLIPAADVTYDLGSATSRWANMYTGDLHLKNERGDWTIIEESDFLTITNNKNGKRYKFVLQEIG